ncbi:F-box family protein [Rhynchospora pubera]|uniref:F-box family protein n=1 Tax=Rhynchospora pubera TaxID=906938 RepID=A0AAV8HIG5_9POAL|nr:F-box family protein [Rhynchospora pubera]
MASSLSREEGIYGDILCNLPECIKQKILIYLPIKEAVRTSILSKSWRHTWSTIPDLVVDCGIHSNVHQNIGNEEELTTTFVDKLFSCHKGNLYKFKLSGVKPDIVFHVRWIETLSQKHVSELILENDTDKFL